MNSFQIIILSFFMSITVMSVSAQNNDSIKINNFSIEKNAQGDSVSLRFHLMIAPGITKANDELLLTPILIDIKGNHSFAFPVIRVNGKIREKIVRRQKVLHSSKAEKDLIYTVSNRQWNTITCSTPMLANQLWIWQAKLVLRRQLGNCCMKKELDMVELFTWNRTDGYSIVKPEIKNKVEIPEMLPHKCATEVLAETEKFVEPIDNYSAGKRILAGEQEGAQIVYFKLAKAEIDSNYLDNERVLEHIIDVIRRISEDPEVEIARVVLLGLSSPEGAFEFNKRLYQIPYRDIVYMESRRRVIHLFGRNGEEYRFYKKMKDLLEEISHTGNMFIRVHCSYVVNYYYIKSLSSTETELLTGEKLPVSGEYKNEALKKFMGMME